MTISLGAILEPGVLRKAWKDIRRRERQVHLTQIPLVRDSTGGIAFDLNLDIALKNLRLRLLDGTYRPSSPIVIEVAKSELLHRRLSFLSFEDSLLLNALVQATRPSLLERMAKWVTFGRTGHNNDQPKNQSDISFDYESWWTQWLRYRNLVAVIEEDTNPSLVISDITNFFGSIDLSLMRSKFSGFTALDEQANNLLFYLLEQLRPAESYRPTASFALPTVEDNTSRMLAHFYLIELDDELAAEGEQGRYTRWVDDMVVSVADEVEAGKVVRRIERALSKLGLVANSSKTKLISKCEFRTNHFEEENGYLDTIEALTEDIAEIDSEDRDEFEERLSNFLDLSRNGNWDRILRRYYTASRRMRSTTLLSRWRGHLVEFPPSGKSILDYVSFFAGDIGFCEQAFDYLRRSGPLFDDTQILLYEAILLKPFANDPTVRQYIVSNTQHHLFGENGFEGPNGHVKGLQALTMYKFGGLPCLEVIASTFEHSALDSPTFATYGLPVLAADIRHRDSAMLCTEHLEDARILRVRALIERLEDGDPKASGVLLGLLDPKETKYPARWVVTARVLPLLRVASRSTSPATIEKLRNATQTVSKKLCNIAEKSLIDHVTLDHLDRAYN